MRKLINVVLLVTIPFIIASCHFRNAEENPPAPAKVELVKGTDKYKLMVNNEPFYIRGAGLEGGSIEELSDHGGNAMRTWRTDNMFRTGQEVLDEAYANDIMVCMGLEIARERHGFDYNDSVAVREQFEYARNEVLKYKDHPALLAWGIGNELNLHYSNPKVWDAVEEISQMIHQVDPNHPTTTMLAGAHKDVVNEVMLRCPSLDFLSFQLYGDIVNLPKYVEESGYKGAFVVSEWGATGHWEVARTEWGRPIEQTSHEKALAYKERYEKVIAAQPEQCIGSFVFLWGQKQERTPTWYGMFLEGGENTESMDVMQYMWTGKWPENRAPMLKKFHLEGKTAYDNVKLKTETTYNAEVDVEDPDDDKLSYSWEIIPEVPENMQSDGGDFEQRPLSVMKKSTDDSEIAFKSPENPGQYRLFIYAYDGHNNAATANIPFLVVK